MVTVGITGGIGSGKTAVCNTWKSLGAYILNADDLAKNLMTNDPEIRDQIKDTFGEESYNENGSLNREYLAEQAFNKGKVKELNAIVHPRIPEKSRQIMEKARKSGYPMFVYEAALLLQNLRPAFLDYVVLVMADEDKRVKRVKERDDVSREQVKERIDKQQNFEELIHLADFIIHNNGTLDELKKKATHLYHELLTPEQSK